MRQEWLDINRELWQYVTAEFKNEFQLLRSIPRVGLIIAIGILAELGDIKRFTKFDQLASFVGLIPSIYSSGETIQVRG